MRKLEISGNDRQRAESHNLGRNVRVVKVLGYLSLMRGAGMRLDLLPVTVEKAEVQAFKAEKNPERMGVRRGTQAGAHFLPGQLKIQGRNPWEFLQDHATMVKLRWLFAEVDGIAENINKADKAAEDCGLIEAFRAACVEVIRDAHPVAGKVNLKLVQDTYHGVWVAQATAAIRRALSEKESKAAMPELETVPHELDWYEPMYTLESIRARSTASEYVWNIEETIAFLKIFEDNMNVEPHELVSLREIEDGFRP